jgi:hypothetical protein
MQSLDQSSVQSARTLYLIIPLTNCISLLSYRSKSKEQNFKVV